MVKWLVVQLSLVNLFANSAYSSIAPFYPLEATLKGVPESYIGFIFSGYSISMVFVSPLAAKMMNKIGRKKIILTGLLLEGTSMIIFGFIDYIDNA
jgi:MFS family permease